MSIGYKAWLSVILFTFSCAVLGADVTKVNLKPDGTEVSRVKEIGNMSADQKWVVYTSTESYSSNQQNNSPLVYLRNKDNNTTFHLSKNAKNIEVNCCDNTIVSPFITADASRVLYLSKANNLVVDDTNSSTDLYIYDINLNPINTKNIYITANLNGNEVIPTNVFSPYNSYSYNHKVNIEIFDNLGQSRLLDLFFRKNAENSWDVFATIDEIKLIDTESALISQRLMFEIDGTISNNVPFVLSKDFINLILGKTSFNSDINIHFQDENGGEHITQLSSAFLSRVLKNDGQSIGQLSRLKNASGVEFDSGIDNYWLIGETNDFFFTSNSSNVTNEVSTAGTRLYKYVEQTQTITLIKDQFSNITVVGTAENKLLLKTTQALTGMSSNYFELYFLDLTTNEYTHIQRPRFISKSIKIQDVILDNAAASLLVQYASYPNYSNSKYAFYDLKTNAIKDLTEEFNQYYKFNSLIGFSQQGDQLLAYSGTSSSPTVWLYNLQLNEGFKIGLNNNEIISGFGILNPFSEHVLFKNSYCYYQCNLNVIDIRSITESLPGTPSYGNASQSELGKISINFEDVEAAIYQIYRHPTLEPEQKVYLGASYSNNYIDKLSDLQIDTEYTYLIKPCNRLFQCNATYSITGGFVVSPEKVSNLQLQSNESSNQGVITWNSQENTTYLIEMKSGNDLITRSSHQSTWSFHRDYNQAYQVTVKACVLNICGLNSDPLNIDAIYQSERPNRFRYFTSEDMNVLILKWQSIPDIKFYKVYGARNGSAKIFRKKVYSAEFTENVIQLGDTLHYYISACKSETNCGVQVSTNFNFVKSAFTLTKPNLTVLNSNSNVNITIKSGYTGSGYDYVRLYRRENRFTQAELVDEYEYGYTFGSNSLSIIDENIEPDTTYFYYVEGCVALQCQYSDDLMLRSNGQYLSEIARIDDLVATKRAHQDHIALQWSVPLGTTKQSLYRRPHGQSYFSHIKTLNPTDTSYQDFSIIPGRKYEYYIKSENGQVNNVQSNYAIGDTFYGMGDVVTPDKPKLTTTLYRYFDKITLTWSAQSNVDTIEIYFSDHLDGEYNKLGSQSHHGNYYTLNYLAPETTLYFKAKACTKYQCSDFSLPVKGGTSNAQTAPLIANAPQLELTAENDVKLTIGAVANAAFYEIKRFTNLYSNPVKVYTTESLTYIDNVNDNSLYYYRVNACNAYDCSAMGEYASINTGVTPQPPVIANKKYFYLYSVSHNDENTINLSLNYNNYSGVSPKHINIYVSQSVNGEKSLVEKQEINIGSSLNFASAAVGVKYYFWIENCFADNVCELNPHYKVGELKAIEEYTIPVPENLSASQGDRVNQIRISWSQRTINGTSVQVYDEDAAGDKRFIGSSNSTSKNINQQSEMYTIESKKYWAKTCFEQICSDYTEFVLGWPAALHGTHISGPENSHLWYTRSVKELNGRLGYAAEYPVISNQYMYHQNGYNLKLSSYLSDSTHINGCSTEMKAGWVDSDNYGRIKFQESIFTIVKVRNGCQNEFLTDIGSYYLVFNNDYSNSVKVEVPEKQWFDISIVINVNNQITVKLPNEQSIVRQLNVNQLFPKFAKLAFTSDGSNYIGDINFESKTNFNSNIPSRNRSVSAYQNHTDSHLVNVSAGGNASENMGKITSELNLIKKLPGSNYELMASYKVDALLFSMQGISLPEVPADYIAATRSCNENGCSAYKFGEFSARESTHYLSRPNVEVNHDVAIGNLGIKWQVVNDATHYQVFISRNTSSSLSSFVVETTGLSYILESLDDAQWFIWVKACNELNQCSDYSYRVSGYPAKDSDNDGLTDTKEIELGTDPYDKDTDDDGIEDNIEINTGTNPTLIDTDGDGISDGSDLNPLLAELTSGDFNRDGKSDLLWFNAKTGFIELWLMAENNFDSKFILPAIDNQNWSIVGTGDFDGDFDTDILLYNKADGKVNLWIMDGSERESVHSLTTMTDLDWNIVGTGDVNNDDKSDIVWHHSKTGQSLVWLMDGSTRNSVVGLPIQNDTSWRLVGIGDTNNDGHDDMFWRHMSNGKNQLWLINNGNVVNKQFMVTINALENEVVGLFDMNNDNKADVLWRNKLTGANKYWQLDGEIRTAVKGLPEQSNLNLEISLVGDVNNDGFKDFIWRDKTSTNTILWLMEGQKLISNINVDTQNEINWKVANNGAQWNTSEVSHDFNGDGYADILWRDGVTGENQLWLMKGGVRETVGSLVTLADTGWQVAGVGDFDLDGKSDVLWHHQGNGKVMLWLMDGSSRRSTTSLVTMTDLNYQGAGVGDFNGDGKADILWRNEANGKNLVWQMDGVTRSSVIGQTRLTDTQWQVAGINDLDGDGTDDIVWRHAGDGRNSLWLMGNGSRQSVHSLSTQSDMDYRIAGVDDLDRDGKADILWRHQSNGKNIYWKMDGAIRGAVTGLTLEENINWQIKQLLDLNGDGIADILWRSNAGNNRIWLMSADGKRQQVSVAGSTADWQVMH